MLLAPVQLLQSHWQNIISYNWQPHIQNLKHIHTYTFHWNRVCFSKLFQLHVPQFQKLNFNSIVLQNNYWAKLQDIMTHKSETWSMTSRNPLQTLHSQSYSQFKPFSYSPWLDGSEIYSQRYHHLDLYRNMSWRPIVANKAIFITF